MIKLTLTVVKGQPSQNCVTVAETGGIRMVDRAEALEPTCSVRETGEGSEQISQSRNRFWELLMSPWEWTKWRLRYDMPRDIFEYQMDCLRKIKLSIGGETRWRTIR